MTAVSSFPSFASEDCREITDDLRRDQLVDEAGRPLVAGGVDRTSWPKPASYRERIVAVAKQWDVGRPIADTLSARYLRLRAITRSVVSNLSSWARAEVAQESTDPGQPAERLDGISVVAVK